MVYKFDSEKGTWVELTKNQTSDFFCFSNELNRADRDDSSRAFSDYGIQHHRTASERKEEREEVLPAVTYPPYSSFPRTDALRYYQRFMEAEQPNACVEPVVRFPLPSGSLSSGKNIVYDYAKRQISPNEYVLFGDTINTTERKPVEVPEEKPFDWNAAKDCIFSSLDWHCLRAGEPTEVEDLLRGWMRDTSVNEVMPWLYRLTLEHSGNTLLLCTVLHALSHLEYDEVYPYGPMLAMAELSHTNKTVIFFAIKSFSNWNAKNSLKYLKDHEPQYGWAKREWRRVCTYIRENGDESNGISDEDDCIAPVGPETG